MMIRVLIVEDDFRVAQINEAYVSKAEGFEVIGATKTKEETLAFLQQVEEFPNLLLLDVYLPDDVQLSLFWTLRKEYPMIDIIMLTAANEVSTIQQLLQGGVFDYLVKPVDFPRFEAALQQYKKRYFTFQNEQQLTQQQLDQLTRKISSSRVDKEVASHYPKGIDKLTLEKMQYALKNYPEGVTATEIAQAIGVSRSTARRYLEYLVSAQAVTAQLLYGEVGRPERRYIVLT